MLSVGDLTVRLVGVLSLPAIGSEPIVRRTQTKC